MRRSTEIPWHAPRVRGGIVRAARRPEGWIARGPKPAGARGREALEPAEGEDLCFLSGDWRIFQEVRGHRWSLDDLVTAWVAAGALGDRSPSRALDLGCGIGSVLMMIAWRFPEARCIGIEAQPARAAKARRSLAWNGADERCEVLDGDLREPGVLPEGARFELVTGTPPYFPPGEGLESPVAERAPCRFEHRGGVEEYLAAASRWVADDGRFVMCAAAGQRERVERGAREAGLAVVDWLEVVPRAGKAPLVAVFALARGEAKRAPTAARVLVVRDERTRWTTEYERVREEMGMPPGVLR